MTGRQPIDYEALTQDALRSIVRTVLLRVAAAAALPGEHHFYIAFATRAPGVVISRRLREKYPEEMTIVLQHQFSRLIVNEERFEVTLSFDNVPERLMVPFRAIRKFFDPSVPFGLQLEGSDLGDETLADQEPGASQLPELGPRPAALRPPDRDAAGAHEPGRLEKVRGPRKPVAPQKDVTDAAPDEASGPAGGQTPRRQAA